MTLWIQFGISLIIAILAILDFSYLKKMEFKDKEYLRIIQYSIVAYFILNIMALSLEIISAILFLISAITIYIINGHIFKYAKPRKPIVETDS